ncbi:DNA topoisomerase 2 [Aphelenchoides fujianensis]|nr:DNA topoisomerase 2 [Aphelenchoides fujianensis]
MRLAFVAGRPSVVFAQIRRISWGTRKPRAMDLNEPSVEDTYKKVTQLEHVLLRPDTYVGSVELTDPDTMWVYDPESDKLVEREVRYVPALYKIFDEILVNAADNKQRDSKMNTIRINIDQKKNRISIYNNGRGIPIKMHKVEKMYVPELIFGTLLTSSNYNDEKDKVVGGRNGYGAKLCNIFSTEFTLETQSKADKLRFKQTWVNNMKKDAEAEVVAAPSGEEDFTKVTFTPDLKRFKMKELDADIIGLMSRRAYDVAGTVPGVKVFLNNKKLPCQGFKQYVEQYTKNCIIDDKPAKLAYCQPHPRWEIGVTLSDRGEMRQVSFVNSIATTKGGCHVAYVRDLLIKELMPAIQKKTGAKSGVNLTAKQVRDHLWLFVNCLIVNPTFDSQTKETLTTAAKDFGSKITGWDQKFIDEVVKKSGIVESVVSWVQAKQLQQQDKKLSSKKTSKIRGIPKLDDANDAGTKNSRGCTLILTEGDSAKSLAVAGLSVLGRDKYGVFPLRGKLLNVREGTHKQIMENAEIGSLIKILGLQYKLKYDKPEDMNTLRYGKVMIMTDQDQDGSHIKGLVINFIHHNWPHLLRNNFLEEFITPIVKASKGNTVYPFYSLPEYAEWRMATENWKTFKIKYYKGLGTSTTKEAREYFSDLNRHQIRFSYSGQDDDNAVELAFSKKKIEQRKAWLTSWMQIRKERREQGVAEDYLYNRDTRAVTYSDFVNRELILFSNMDNERSIPSLVDGLKPGQRKVMFTCFKFGTRAKGGKEAASPRYIFTQVNPVSKALFPTDDEHVLRFLFEENKRIEPEWYCPVIPTVLVNGAQGIGTGWSTQVPNYNPREVVENVRRLIRGEELVPLQPWYKKFAGDTIQVNDGKWMTIGNIGIIDEETIEITELPVKRWTQDYKEKVLHPLLEGTPDRGPMIQDYKEYHSEETVKFVIKMDRQRLRQLEQEDLHTAFKLVAPVHTTSMVLFDAAGCLRRFHTPEDICREFFDVRKQKYIERKAYIEGMLTAQSERLSEQARFILLKIENKIHIENKKKAAIIEQLKKHNFKPDPVKKWKNQQQRKELEHGGEIDEEELDEERQELEKAEGDHGVVDYDYLVGMQIWKLSMEDKEELLAQAKSKKEELEVLIKKQWNDLWEEDLEKKEQADVEKTIKEAIAKLAKDASSGNKKKARDLQAAQASVKPDPNAVIVKPDVVLLKSKHAKETKKAKAERLLENGEEAPKRGKKAAAPKKEKADGEKPKKAPAKPKTAKKRHSWQDTDESGSSFDDEDFDENDDEDLPEVLPVKKERKPRAVVSDDEEEDAKMDVDSLGFEEEDEEEKPAPKKKPAAKAALKVKTENGAEKPKKAAAKAPKAPAVPKPSTSKAPAKRPAAPAKAKKPKKAWASSDEEDSFPDDDDDENFNEDDEEVMPKKKVRKMDA